MSQRSYNKMWAEAHLELNRLLKEEQLESSVEPEIDRVVFFQRVAVLYMRYLKLFRQLEKVYDQVIHPQKRRAIRPTLDGVMGRVLELKYDMVETEFSEYHYLDDVLHDMKLTPADLEVPIPEYFTSERGKEEQERNAMLMKMLKKVKVGRSRSRSRSQEPINAPTMSLEEAVKVIQIAERARQGRLRAKLNRESRNMNWMYRTDDPGADVAERAAVCIQKVWRGFIQRRKTRIAREEEMIFLGMAMDPKYQKPLPSEIAAQDDEDKTRLTREEYEEDYQKTVESLIKQLKDVEGLDISKTMKDQIRQWFLECRDTVGTFPEYPCEEDGGSAPLFVNKDPQQLIEELAAKEEEESEKTPAVDSLIDDENEIPGLMMLPSAFLKDLKEAQSNYTDFWKCRNEQTNFNQRHDVELMKEEQRKVVEAEIRKQVDEEMRQELAKLKLVVDKEKGGKGTAKKKKGAKSGKKKKKEKDLTSDRTLESLCEELVQQRLLKLPNNHRIQEFLGDYSYLGTTLRQNDTEPMPSLSDVRQVVSLYAVLPLGSQAIHEKAPLIKAILLAGPSGVGKKMLVHAICQETGAALFDLSPLITAGKYPGKAGLTMMLHMVFKVAKLLQPSVICIEDAEKIFYKKVPKEEKELDPKRLKKDLLKSLKLIKGEDRVLIVGTTKDPQSAEIKSFCKMYSKIILIPRPDYGSRCILWKKLIQKQGGVITAALDLSSLAKLSDGYTPGHMVQVIQSVVTKHRISQQETKPLTAAEFVAPLAKIDPIFQEEEEAFKNWYTKTPMGKKRAKAATGNDDEPLVEAKAPKKKK
ncbi:dynein regulatory complex protein 11 isoform X2 [Takifugu rubripes]|uniref:IQ motif containing with AAA domain 1 n=1 Tax=Takifugu rubripes TaxID=31033 RepID=A0A3B5KTG8_TAKRU|nr:dynein regulatory complex protein 11 isoform X2 [Takifugu rubripes]